MSGYRDELDSALRQLDELRAEAARLRAELDATRAASGSSVAHALVFWTRASRATRALIALAPIAVIAAGAGSVLALRSLDARTPPRPPPGAVEPLTRAPPTPVCPPQRPCIERHREVAPAEQGELPPPPALSSQGLVAEGPYAGTPYLGPWGADPTCDPRDGVLVLHTQGRASCVIGSHSFTAPGFVRLREGDYDLRCAAYFTSTRKRWRVRIVAGQITQSWLEDVTQPNKRGSRARPDPWLHVPGWDH